MLVWSVASTAQFFAYSWQAKLKSAMKQQLTGTKLADG
jgi:hypothetical protein